MIKIIEKKVYNTETAELIARYDNGRNVSDFNYIIEELFKTKKGTWFLYTEGGAATKYARKYGNNQSVNSNDIELLTNNEAYNWLEKNDEIEAINTYFKDDITAA